MLEGVRLHTLHQARIVRVRPIEVWIRHKCRGSEPTGRNVHNPWGHTLAIAEAAVCGIHGTVVNDVMGSYEPVTRDTLNWFMVGEVETDWSEEGE